MVDDDPFDEGIDIEEDWIEEDDEEEVEWEDEEDFGEYIGE